MRIQHQMQLAHYTLQFLQDYDQNVHGFPWIAFPQKS